ncbi:hypothetical protein QQ73_09810, partial [Candidatus Endoriftia persephone str. Guaymas]|nr:hypothetical protein [Candidatus Endoriftia persephone str. Guaymas]
WVQIDEPALVLELPQAWLDAYKPAYDALQGQVKLLLTTYFEDVTTIDQTRRQQPVRRQALVQFSNVIFTMYEVNMQTLN